MATFTEAVHTVEAMAAIPCLRGGFACFDDDLNAVGWDHWQDNLGTTWARVPQDPANAERELRAAIDEKREGLEQMIAFYESDESSLITDKGRREGPRECRASLERLNAMVGEAA